MKIRNENDFLGCLISVRDKDNDVDLSKAMHATGFCNLDFSIFLKKLEDKEVIMMLDTETCHLYQWSIDSYQSPMKIALFKIGKLLLLTVKNVVIYVGGIVSGIVVAYISFLLNNMLK